MRRDRFTPIQDRFIKLFETEAEAINRECPFVRCNVEVHYPPEDDPKRGSFSMHLSCLIYGREFEGADNVSLSISANDWHNLPKLGADVCWGHPSGQIEGDIFGSAVELTEDNLETLETKLPALIDILRKSLQKAK